MKAPRLTTEELHARGWHWMLLGCALQGVIFLLDTVTPLGFAHGVLYALPVPLGLVARRMRAIWLLSALGVVGAVLGTFVSEGRLPGVEDQYIWFNRALGVGVVLMAGIVCGVVLRLMRLRSLAYEALEKTAGLLEVSSTVGKLGG